MFQRQCGNQNDHDPHVYEKIWFKADLPHLLHPDEYPDKWIARYKCTGKNVQAFTVEYLHEDCTPCEACADMAVEAAWKNLSETEVWRELGPNDEVRHMAEVSRL